MSKYEEYLAQLPRNEQGVPKNPIVKCPAHTGRVSPALKCNKGVHVPDADVTHFIDWACFNGYPIDVASFDGGNFQVGTARAKHFTASVRRSETKFPNKRVPLAVCWKSIEGEPCLNGLCRYLHYDEYDQIIKKLAAAMLLGVPFETNMDTRLNAIAHAKRLRASGTLPDIDSLLYPPKVEPEPEYTENEDMPPPDLPVDVEAGAEADAHPSDEEYVQVGAAAAVTEQQDVAETRRLFESVKLTVSDWSDE
jgi:hypothetical protein